MPKSTIHKYSKYTTKICPLKWLGHSTSHSPLISISRNEAIKYPTVFPHINNMLV